MVSIEENKNSWGKENNWKFGGNEWSESWHSVEAQWLFFLYPRIKKFLSEKTTVLEIAPGYGRWTQYLLKNCKKYIGIDLNSNCINYCKARFFMNPKAKFYANNGKSLEKVKDNSIDFCFSFDSLVHADKDAIEPYIQELSKKLKDGGFAFIHHSNCAQYCQNSIHTPHWRSCEVEHLYVQEMCKKYNLHCISQELIKWQVHEEEVGYIDCISIIHKNSKMKNVTTSVFKDEFFKFTQNYAGYLAENYGFKEEKDFISHKHLGFLKFRRLKYKILSFVSFGERRKRYLERLETLKI